MSDQHNLGDAALILAAGMPRSASTWLYNAARAVLCCDPEIAENLSAGWIGDLQALPEARYRLIKVHKFVHAQVARARFILYSFRDLRDVLASMKRKFDVDPTLDYADELIQLHDQWMERADVVMRYETMLEEQEPVILSLADLFDINGVEPALVAEQLDALNYASKGEKNPTYHNVNLYHRGHFTDGRHGSWVDTLDNALVKRLEDRYRSWFEQNDYSIEY